MDHAFPGTLFRFPMCHNIFSNCFSISYNRLIPNGLEAAAPKRLTNNSKSEEKKGQIKLKIQKEGKTLSLKAIVRQPPKTLKFYVVSF